MTENGFGNLVLVGREKLTGLSGIFPDKIALQVGRKIIGRSNKADIKISAEREGKFIISRSHAAIKVNEESHAVEVEDLGALNGIFVNDVRVETAPLRHGDVIQFGGMSEVPFGKRLTGGDLAIRYVYQAPNQPLPSVPVSAPVAVSVPVAVAKVPTPGPPGPSPATTTLAPAPAASSSAFKPPSAPSSVARTSNAATPASSQKRVVSHAEVQDSGRGLRPGHSAGTGSQQQQKKRRLDTPSGSGSGNLSSVPQTPASVVSVSLPGGAFFSGSGNGNSNSNGSGNSNVHGSGSSGGQCVTLRIPAASLLPSLQPQTAEMLSLLQLLRDRQTEHAQALQTLCQSFSREAQQQRELVQDLQTQLRLLREAQFRPQTVEAPQQQIASSSSGSAIGYGKNSGNSSGNISAISGTIVSEVFRCGLCREPLLDACVARCSHAFCALCLSARLLPSQSLLDAFRRPSSSSTGVNGTGVGGVGDTCPLCDTAFFADDDNDHDNNTSNTNSNSSNNNNNSNNKDARQTQTSSTVAHRSSAIDEAVFALLQTDAEALRTYETRRETAHRTWRLLQDACPAVSRQLLQRWLPSPALLASRSETLRLRDEARLRHRGATQRRATHPRHSANDDEVEEELKATERRSGDKRRMDVDNNNDNDDEDERGVEEEVEEVEDEEVPCDYCAEYGHTVERCPHAALSHGARHSSDDNDNDEGDDNDNDNDNAEDEEDI